MNRGLWAFQLTVLLIAAANSDVAAFVNPFDREGFEALYDAPPQSEPLGTIMENVTEVGNYRTLLGLSIVFMAYGGEVHHDTGKLLASAYVASALGVFGAKNISRRTRPFDKELGDSSFPSGHTAYAFAGATILGNRYPKLRIPLYLVAGLVGVSRVYLGRHYPTDVIGGAIVGTVAGTLVWRYRATVLRWEF